MSDQDRLSGLDFKNDAGDVKTYSRFIKSIQYILPIGILTIIGVLVLWPQLSKIETSPLTQADLKALKSAETENILLKPTFNTQDEKGNPVEISASNARQAKDEDNVVTLDNPSAKINDQGRILEFNAQKGVYNQSTKMLTLENNVMIRDSQNNILETGNITADINKNIATSTSPAKLTTDQGTIEGQSVIIDQENQITTFKGPAKAVINP